MFKEVRSEYFADINAIINLFYYYYYKIIIFFKLFFFKHVFTRTVTFECVEKYANESILQLKKQTKLSGTYPS